MPASNVLRLQAKPGEGARLVALVTSLLEDTMKHEGALGFEMPRDLGDPDVVVLIERWRERADHEAYSRWRQETGIGLAEMAAILGAPPEQAYYETIAERS
jgi:quinol monooxygenase YgiN